jgi:hypothetical protein
MSDPVARFSPCHLNFKWRRKSCFGDYFFSACASSAWASSGMRFRDFRIFFSRWRGSVAAVFGWRLVVASGKATARLAHFRALNCSSGSLFITTVFAFFQHFFEKINLKMIKNVPSFPVRNGNTPATSTARRRWMSVGLGSCLVHWVVMVR